MQLRKVVKLVFVKRLPMVCSRDRSGQLFADAIVLTLRNLSFQLMYARIARRGCQLPRQDEQQLPDCVRVILPIRNPSLLT